MRQDWPVPIMATMAGSHRYRSCPSGSQRPVLQKVKREDLDACVQRQNVGEKHMIQRHKTLGDKRGMRRRLGCLRDLAKVWGPAAPAAGDVAPLCP